ncbi:leucine richcontaining 57 [Trypanosoma rangeli]|uniref:Leucine richcontaining 57 n=1 Tax=Trypanosoma rangeli TaxID=5698 RepID=A0A3R7NP81_TRYRA|nr:leucine richcontaining 57 [Trypanosoma rangeli]RNF05595.1 leucine richcontaining 57 [Trypanosoma rangeli]|eukprot:RNF05595.1 leucine richcontaining 57 [Trypanosoma rangeli]
MGGKVSRERVDGATATGVLVLSRCNLHSWKKIVKTLAGLSHLRGVALDRNRLSKPLPSSVLRLDMWFTLRTLDLSSNDLTCACVLGGLGGCTSSKKNEKRTDSLQVVYPLESLNLSNNRLLQLPPLLLVTFPKLRRLLCRGNTVPLDMEGGFACRVGSGAALTMIDLGCSQLRSFYLLDGSVEGAAPEGSFFPSLSELLLDGNSLGGTFTLVSSQWEGPKAGYFPLLKTINIASQKQILERVDPSVYVVAPSLHKVILAENAMQDAMMADLRHSKEYQQWAERRKSGVDKQLRFTGSAALM